MPHTLRPWAHRLLVIAGLLLCVTSHAAAQGRITGRVLDRDGAPVVGAMVTAEELASSAASSATTNSSGRFSFIGLNRGDWLFVIRADGFEPVQGTANMRASGPGTAVQFTMERDFLNPPAPAGGVLAGLKATQLFEDLEQADRLFDAGDYQAALQAYRALLESAPALTSVNLQIGHAHLARQEPEQALEAYRTALAADPSSVEAAAAVASAGTAARDQ